RLFAEKQGAAISVETKEGVGTSFHLWFAQANFTEAQQTSSPEVRPDRHTLLVVGAAGELLDRMVDMLRQNGYYVVPAGGEADAVEALHAPHFQFTGLVLLCTTGRAEELALAQRVRAHKLPLKILLSLFSCNQDELASSLLDTVDAIVPFDVPAHDFLNRLKTVLDSP
ncbi:MAG TPA: hypothetical protein VNT26_22240, partial [Candidatus Sulfotelmatobacter sp.]|nr:hypothetical protein [Candidatus Sulfotelmatobacter sp.]